MIPDNIEKSMTNDYLKSIIINSGGTFKTNDKREDLKENLYELKQQNKIDDLTWLKYLVETYKYGSNRIVLCNLIDVRDTNAICRKGTLENLLTRKNEPTGYINKIAELTDFEGEEDSLLYQQINYDTDGKTKYIERAYCRNHNVVITDENGESTYSVEKVITWTIVDIENQEVRIHTKDLTANYFGKNNTLRNTNNKFFKKIKKLFNITQQSTINHKATLFNIYKEMTETAEAPFKEKITNEIQGEIISLCKSISENIGYNINADSLKIPNRIQRLFERGLINQEYDLYSMYADGKVGIIKRIVFDDNTGANVSAMVKELTDNISSYDIYFDTRDTLDEKKALNKLWASWYYKSISDRKEEKYEVKMEILEDFYIIHFMRGFALEEVVNHVLSKFREFA